MEFLSLEVSGAETSPEGDGVELIVDFRPHLSGERGFEVAGQVFLLYVVKGL